MPTLPGKLRDRIVKSGPLTIEQYMSEALSDPEYGYYRVNHPIGKKGDFITSPEISQLFGEMIGLWCAVSWQQMGSPSDINLIELGPGRGTMIFDVLRTIDIVPEFKKAAKIHLVESNRELQKLQQKSMGLGSKNCIWHETFDSVPEAPFLVLANEFLDALPIRQFLFTKSGWCERQVDFDKEENAFTWTLGEPQTSNPYLLEFADRKWSDGIIYEFSQLARELTEKISTGIIKNKGRALLIDYGYNQNQGGDTFQAIHNHKYVNPLVNAGDADLSAHVDFGAVKLIAEKFGVKVNGPITQRDFLIQLGVEVRAKKLMDKSSTEQAINIKTGLDRLISRARMGELFKVICLSNFDTPPPEGFEGIS